MGGDSRNKNKTPMTYAYVTVCDREAPASTGGKNGSEQQT